MSLAGVVQKEIRPIFVFWSPFPEGPEEFPGLSRNGPKVRFRDSPLRQPILDVHVGNNAYPLFPSGVNSRGIITFSFRFL